jgi:lipoprotein-releasing system permease protein
MNGFDYEIHNRIFNMADQVMISGVDGTLKNWQELNKYIKGAPRVIAAAPLVVGQGMVAHSGEVSGVMIKGVVPEIESNVSSVKSYMTEGSMNALKNDGFGVVMGEELAAHLGVGLGDKLMLMVPQASVTPVGVMPRFKRFEVVGLFHVGGGFGFDSGVVFLNLHDAQKLLQLNDVVSGVRLKVASLYDAPFVAEELTKKLPHNYIVRDWTAEYGAYFQAIKMEKTTMFVVLLFIIAIAAFNLISSLVMTVTDKSAEIAILRTIGANPKLIMSIFMVQGSVIGIVGTVLGVMGGIIMALNAPYLVKMLEQVFNLQLISSSVYFIDYLPSKLVCGDVIRIGLASLLMSLVATIYPALRAASVAPAAALKSN